MSTRRDLLIGGVCLAGAGGGYALKPRRQIALLGPRKLATIVPASFGDWVSRDVGDLVAPATDGSLEARLYSQTLERVYQRRGAESGVMMLMAYGTHQTNDLQLHRPEVCYPAFGFRLTSNTATTLQLGPGTSIGARQITASSKDRQENILYWTRIGEFLPTSGSQQRLDRIKLALHGTVGDGLLARFSTSSPDADAAFQTLRHFIPGLIAAVAPAARNALIGSDAAKSLQA